MKRILHDIRHFFFNPLKTKYFYDGFQTTGSQRFSILATLRFIKQYEEFAGGNIILN